MKSILACILLFTVFNLFSQSTTLRLASDAWPPFTDVESKPAFALNLVSEALARRQVNAHTEILSFTEVIQEIRSGKFDGSAALWHSPERAEFLLYSEPYLENRLILVGKKGSNVDYKNFSELKGKRIAVVESYAYGDLGEGANDIELVAGKSDQQNLERLLKGEADYMLVDALLIEYVLKYQSEDAAKYLEIGTNTMLKRSLYFAIRRDFPGADMIIRNFSAEIKKMIADGSYNRILQLNWIASDVDGDGRTELVLSGDAAGTNEPVHSYTVMSPAGSTANDSNRYYIEGSDYEDWERVPEKYKVQPTMVPYAQKSGFGPVFSF